MPIEGQNGINLRYEPGLVGAEALRLEILSILAELSDHTLSAEDGTSGPESTNAFDNAQVSVDQEGKGFGIVILIITILAPAANHVIKSTWDNVILPQIKARLGDDALGKEVESGSGGEDGSKD